MNSIFVHHENNVVIDFSLKKKKTNKKQQRIEIGNDKNLNHIYNCLINNMKFSNKKYYLSLNEQNEFTLDILYYVYYENEDTILSIGPTKDDKFESNENINCDMALADNIANNILNGGLHSYRIVKTKDSSLIELAEKGNFIGQITPKTINSFKIKFPIKNTENKITYNRKTNSMKIKQRTNYYKWIFISEKNNPLIVLKTYKSLDIERLSEDSILLKSLPNLPDLFDIYASSNDDDKFQFEVINE